MKATDFRIGNYLLEEKYNMIVTVIDLSENRIGVTGDFKGRWQVNPILLTEEWLLSLGFEIEPKSNFNVKLFFIENNNHEFLSLGVRDDEWHLFEGKNDAYCNKINYTQLKYVHQLQNLYFVLTNKDLTIVN